MDAVFIKKKEIPTESGSEYLLGLWLEGIIWDKQRDILFLLLPLQAQKGMSLFLTSVLTMDSSQNSGSQHQQFSVPVAKQVADQKRHHRCKRKHRGPKIIISNEYRNIKIPEIPPFDPQAVKTLGTAAVTHNIAGDRGNLEIFERDPRMFSRTVLCRSNSVK